MSRLENAGAVLTIDLDAIGRNYRQLCDRLTPSGATCAAVVKADGYGLGADKVAPALAAAGCHTFFVSLIDEGIALRRCLGEDAEIHILAGYFSGTEDDLAAHRLIPVLNSLGDVERWSRYCARREIPLPADIHVDTGMTRLGLSLSDVATLTGNLKLLGPIGATCLLSHLACADQPDHPLNQKQLELFNAVRADLPAMRISFANSSGIFLGPQYHFDMVRPGAALYGVAPVSGQPNPMENVLRLQGKVLQLRDVDTPLTVGYGASYSVAGDPFSGGIRIATLAIGYADGYLRSLSNTGCAHIDGVRVAVIGRVSMDLITLDVSNIAADKIRPGTLVDLIGPDNTIDQVANDAGTIGYEILTSLGNRYHRVYAGGVPLSETGQNGTDQAAR